VLAAARQRHKLPGILHWQQAQQNLVHQRENGCIRSNARASESTATTTKIGDL
jgi:hypothetical protein